MVDLYFQLYNKDNMGKFSTFPEAQKRMYLMKSFFNLLIILVLLSCIPENKHGISQKTSTTLITKEEISKINKDTVITYNIEEMSSEGAEAIVTYKNGQIEKSEITVYGETGQARITYFFNNNQVNVAEKKYSYNNNIENINSEKDMKLIKDISYSMDLNGTPLTKVDNERLDIFQEFKELVPFYYNVTMHHNIRKPSL